MSRPYRMFIFIIFITIIIFLNPFTLQLELRSPEESLSIAR